MADLLSSDLFSSALDFAGGVVDMYPGLDDNEKEQVRSGKESYSDLLQKKKEKAKMEKETAELNNLKFHGVATGNKQLVGAVDFAKRKKEIIALRRKQAQAQGINDAEWSDDTVYNGLLKRIGDAGMTKLLNGDYSYFQKSQQAAGANPSISTTGKEETMSLGGKIGVGAAIAGANYLVSSGLERVGKTLYNQTLKAVADPKKLIAEGEMLSEWKAAGGSFGKRVLNKITGLGPKKPKTIATTALETPGIWGTPTGISADAIRWADKIWKSKVIPVMNEINKTGWRLTKEQLKKSAYQAVDKLNKIKDVQGYGDALKNEIDDFFESRITNKGPITSWKITQMQAEKTALRDSIQQKVLNGQIPEKVGKYVDKVVSDTFDGIVKTKLSRVVKGGKEAVEAYKDYWNLKAIEPASKSYKHTPFKGGGAGVIGSAQQGIGVPVGSTVFRGLNKFGKYSNVPMDLVRGVKYVAKKLKGGVGTVIKGVPAVFFWDAMMPKESIYKDGELKETPEIKSIMNDIDKNGVTLEKINKLNKEKNKQVIGKESKKTYLDAILEEIKATPKKTEEAKKLKLKSPKVGVGSVAPMPTMPQAPLPSAVAGGISAMLGEE